jgi:hypothetical protein
MVQFCVKQQTEAKRELQADPNDAISKHCKKQWGNNYNMFKFCIQQQREAKRRLGI